jgi:hypothetical protein
MTRQRRDKRKVTLSIEWTERALADLRAIEAYIAADSPAAAERWWAGSSRRQKPRAGFRWPSESSRRRHNPTSARCSFEPTAWHRLFPRGAADPGDG